MRLLLQVVDRVPPWSWGLWKGGTWNFSTVMLIPCTCTTSTTRSAWLQKKRLSFAQVGCSPLSRFRFLPSVTVQPVCSQGKHRSLSNGQHHGQLSHIPASPPAFPTFHTIPLLSLLLHPKCFFFQNPTQTPSTVTSSAGCCVTLKVMKRPGRLMPTSVSEERTTWGKILGSRLLLSATARPSQKS